MRVFLTVLFLFLFTKLNAQSNFLETSSKINALFYNKASNQIIYANDNYVFYADYDSMTVKDSVVIHSTPNKYIHQFQFLNTPNPFLILKTKTKNTHYTEFYEYPSDSIYYLNLNLKTVVNRFPGNLYATYNEKNANQSVVAYNQYFSYNNARIGKMVTSASKGGLQSYPEKKEAKSNGIVRNLKLSPNGKEVAIIYYDSIGNDNHYYYTMELRSFPSLDVLKTKSILNKTKAISFSEDGKYLILKKDLNNTGFTSLSTNEDVEIFEANTLKKLNEVPEDLFMEGLVENGSIWKKVENEVINETYKSKEVIHKIWANLTPFSTIDGFVKANDDKLLIYGNSGYGLSEEKNGIYKYSLSNQAIYSKNESIKAIDTLFNPNKIIIANNKVNGDNIQLNDGKDILLLTGNNRIQIWSPVDKRKLYDLEFENEINNFIDSSGKECLIFESHTGKSYNEFEMKSLDLKTGVSISKLFEDPDFKALTAKCFDVKGAKGEWLCSDGSSKLWKINSNDKTIKAIHDFKNPNYYRTDITSFNRLPGTNNTVFSVTSVNVAPNFDVTESKFEGFKLYDADSNEIKTLSNIPQAERVFPVSNNQILYESGDNVMVYNVTTQSSNKIQSNPKYQVLKTVQGKDQTYIVFENKKESIDSFLVSSYNYRTNKVGKSFKIPYSKSHFVTDDGFHFKASDQFFIYNILLDKSVAWNNPKHLFTQNTDLSVASNGKLLFRNKWLIDLKTLEVETQIPSFYSSVLLENNQLFYIDKEQYNVNKPYFQFKISDKNNIDEVLWESKTFPIKNYESPNTTSLSKNKRYILAYDNMAYNGQTLYLIDLENKIVKTKKIDFDPKHIAFTEDERFLVLVNQTQDFPAKRVSLFFDVSTLKLVSEVEANYQSQVSSDSFLQIDGQFLVKNKMSGNEMADEKTYYARKYLTVAKYIPSKSMLVAGSENGELFFWNEDNQSPKQIIKVSNSNILKIEKVGDKLFILSKDSEISIVNLNTLNLNVTCSFFEKDETVSMAWFTPEGYFKASKNDIRNFHFVKDGKPFPLLSYELFLNRPDVIMQKVGFTPTSTIKIYNEAYKKRLQRNHYNDQMDFLSIDRPKVDLVNRNEIPSIVNSNMLQLEIKNISNAGQLVIYINGVPVSKQNVKKKPIIYTEIALGSGNNAISIISKLKSGIESDPVTLEINNVLSKKESKIYYVGVGVSKYQDTSMNLKYADKDVRKMSDVLSNRFEGRIVVDTLLNENATKNNITSLKEKLKETSIDDTVIISFSGHGLIDKEHNFYFAAHDIDFNNPSINGVTYEAIQDLLSGIPARKKLILLDACHSGEIDSNDDLEDTTLTNENVSQVIPDGAKGSKVIKSKKGLNNSFELMQSLFYDMDRGNGSYVISAAGGYEFAYENEKWGNGVFTYSFINALYDLENGTWSREEGIPISKIKKYVYDSVKKLTNNKQKPTARAENLEWDWKLE